MGQIQTNRPRGRRSERASTKGRNKLVLGSHFFLPYPGFSRSLLVISTCGIGDPRTSSLSLLPEAFYQAPQAEEQSKQHVMGFQYKTLLIFFTSMRAMSMVKPSCFQVSYSRPFASFFAEPLFLPVIFSSAQSLISSERASGRRNDAFAFDRSTLSVICRPELFRRQRARKRKLRYNIKELFQQIG